jgi:hypothetical protein
VTIANLAATSSSATQLYVFRVAGAAFDAAPAGITGNNVTSVTSASTTGTNGGLALAVFYVYNGGLSHTLAAGTGFTSDGQVTGNIFGTGIGEHENLAATGTVSGAGAATTPPSNVVWAGQMLTLKPSGAAPAATIYPEFITPTYRFRAANW